MRPERISASEELGYIRDSSKIVSHAGLVTLLRGPIAGNAASREQDQRSARWPTRYEAMPVSGSAFGDGLP